MLNLPTFPSTFGLFTKTGLEGSSLAAASPLRASKERLVVLQRKGGAVLTILSPPKPAARSRLIIGDFGPSDSALAAASGGRLRRPAADRHAARCASRDLCSGVRPSALYALGGALRAADGVNGNGRITIGALLG